MQLTKEYEFFYRIVSSKVRTHDIKKMSFASLRMHVEAG